MSAKFAPLFNHSHYSLLRALPKIPDLVAQAHKEGCEALALTDTNNLYGAIEFVKECKKVGIKPIIGILAPIEGGSELVLLAANEEGYKNLLALVSLSRLADAAGVPLSLSQLSEHKEGIVAVEPSTRTERNAEYERVFGAQYFDGVAMHEVFYLEPEDRRAWETMRAIENRGPADDIDTLDEEDDDHSFPSAKTMAKKFSKEALEKSLEVAALCNLELQLGTWAFPEYPIPQGSTPNEELRALVEEGLKKRILQITPQVRERIEYEYKVITDKGYAPYFLVVADLLRYAREHKILTTIRGSVAGSLVTYVTGITNVNPLEYKLPFERFLNPQRPSAPDIDMDFADNRRDEVIEYARKKYGEEKVAQIGTFGTMLARGVVRDVARALGYPYGLGDRVAKEVPLGSQGFPMTLERALKESAELAKMYKQEREVREIIDLGKKIEGCARHISVHAAGVVIAPRPLVEFTPLQLDPKGGKIITQYDMYSIDENNAGLLKFDFLGIRNLSILASAVALVETTRGIIVDIEHVPVDDTLTFQMLARGETEGTFQLNGAGMTRYLKELRPTTIHDINAMVALFRPGPMETIPTYIERKHNPHLVTYPDPRMKEYLEFSNGVLVYQDDVLLTAITLGGYSWLEADMLRKAMGKKIPEVMEAEREKLIKGFVEYGKLSTSLAEKLWKLIEPFAAYGFNKAHAASYGRVAYQTSYMKAHYPVEYMAAVLTAEAGDVDTVGIMVAECKRMGIPVLPPSVNESFGDFTVVLGTNSTRTEKAAALAGSAEEDAIRFGLYSIKNFGRGVADSIIAERKRGGKFTSLSDFLSRIADERLNKKGLESLIQCGALDEFGTRGTMLAHIEQLLQFLRDSSKDTGQDSLFAGTAAAELSLPNTPDAELSQKLAWEKELLGLYVSGHPLDQHKEKLKKSPMTISELRERTRPGQITIAAGMIEQMRTILTRGGDQMAFITLADPSGSVEAVVFPKQFAEHKTILHPDSCIALKAKVSNRNGEFSLVVEALKAL